MNKNISEKVRPLHEIAREIRANWKMINPAARPYLNAMQELNRITEDYYSDSARDVVLYFLSNAKSFKGEKAREIKIELQQILKTI